MERVVLSRVETALLFGPFVVGNVWGLVLSPLLSDLLSRVETAGLEEEAWRVAAMPER
jgi:hypothetical protein